MARTKKKEKDFKKVKLKVGKKLKKPTETNTAFKTGKVVLLEQLKCGAEQNEKLPSTERKLLLPDLLRRLRHYNSKVRKGALDGLKRLLEMNVHLIKENLFTLIESLGQLLLNTELEILKTSAAVWEIIFSSVESSSLAPYWELLSVYLTCAMTHLNSDVKRYSLNLFNVLLTSHVELFRLPPTYKLLRSFFDSLPNSASANTTGSTNTGRHLMSSSSKCHLLKTLKNILSLVDADAVPTEKNGAIICHAASSATVSVSLIGLENGINELDDYVRPQSSIPTEMDRYVDFINRIFPFCHSLWIEVTSVEERQGVDCFTYDLVKLLMMNDILHIYNKLLCRPILLSTSIGGTITDTDIEKFSASLKRIITKNFIDKYSNCLPCRRSPRSSSESLLLVAGSDINIDVCSSVNFGLCRFLAYIAAAAPHACSYPAEKISDVLSYSFLREKIDTETLRAGAGLVCDLLGLGSSFAQNDTFKAHDSQLKAMLMDCLVKQNKRWKLKADILVWMCEDLEGTADLSQSSWLYQCMEHVPSIMSALVQETKSNSAFNMTVLALLQRLTRILLLRSKNAMFLLENIPGKNKTIENISGKNKKTENIPGENNNMANIPGEKNMENIPGGVEKMKTISSICNNLMALLLPQIDRFPATSKREVLNLLFYAVPLEGKVLESVLGLLKDRGGPEADAVRALLVQ